MGTPVAVIERDSPQEVSVGQFGSISIRVVVLPKIKKKDTNKEKGKRQAPKTTTDPLDLEESEFLPETGKTPLGSYLESGKGGRQCCVFLVNGQRQDSLDNGFIIQELGFKYLRSRMMIIVDVDMLTPEAIGRLMQGSRQGFYRGNIFEAITKRLVSTLKGDPDLERLEQEAEEEVSELKAGDEKVTQTLDQLIDSHHDHSIRMAEGVDAQGVEGSDGHLGLRTEIKDGVVSLLYSDEGIPADYPVLVSQPASSYVRLKPKEKREISIKSLPSNAWPALAELTIEEDPNVPELKISQERLGDHLKLGLLFREGAEFDPNQYPLRAKLRATARFNGINEPRRLDLGILIKPDVSPPPPDLVDSPTWIRVSSRQPIKIKPGDIDTHVRIRWNGKDELITGPESEWHFYGRVLNRQLEQPLFNFSQPSSGAFTMLITPRPEWNPGLRIRFVVGARHISGTILTEAAFDAIIVEPPTPPEPSEKEPRQIDDDVMTGSMRRPPYILKIIGHDEYETGSCWGGVNWTDQDPACFLEPTERQPLTLIINQDMGILRDYRRFLTKKFTETEVERRINKYTSHVAFHLFQMYEWVRQNPGADRDEVDQKCRSEVQRVSSTLIRLMEVSR